MVARAGAIELTAEEERELRRVLRTPSASQQRALRARIVLRAAAGATNTQIAAEAGVALPTDAMLRRQFCGRRPAALAASPPSARPPQPDDGTDDPVAATTPEAPT